MFSTKRGHAHQLTLPDLHALAKSSLLVQRNSPKFCPEAFLFTLIKGVISGRGTLRKLAQNMGKSLDNCMSKQALWQRFTPKSTTYLQSVLNALMEQRLAAVRTPLLNANIKRVVVEDSTSLVMNKKNAEHFPAHGNHCGATAGVKIDLAYDLMSGSCVSHTLNKATEQDKLLGKEVLSFIEPGDLVLRDMGYFVIASFIEIEGMNAHWLSRLPLNCNASLEKGDSIEKLLKYATSNIIDQQILLGEKDKHPCRLVAIRADSKLVEQRRRNRRELARKKGVMPSAKGLIRDGWHLMVTSLTFEQASAGELAQLYTSRWSIELEFRGLKGELNLKGVLNRKTNEHHHYALIISAMIAHQISMKFWNIYEPVLHSQKKRLSLEKLMGSVIDMLSESSFLKDLYLFNPDPRHIAYEKRANRLTHVNQAFMPLT